MSKKVTTISPQRLHEIWDEGKRINLVDVRTAAEYRAGHVAGARLIPLDELSSETLAANEHYAGAGHEEDLSVRYARAAGCCEVDRCRLPQSGPV